MDYNYFKKNYKLKAIGLSKEQATDPKAIWKIIFTGNLAMFFIIEGAKETILECSQGTVRVS